MKIDKDRFKRKERGAYIPDSEDTLRDNESSNMRVLVLTTSFPSSAYPGSGIFVRRMLAHLPAKFQITVLTPDHDCTFEAISDPRVLVKSFRYAPRLLQTLAHKPGGLPVSLRQNPVLWFWMPFFVAAMLFSTLVEARRADIINAQWSLCGVVAGVVGWILCKPVITTLRGEDVYRSRTSILFRLLLDGCSFFSHHMVTVSDIMARKLTRVVRYTKNRVSVIPNGVMPSAQNGERSDAGQPTCISIGSLIPRKQMETVILAYASVLKAVPDLKLEIIGEGPERERLSAMAAHHGVAESVAFSGMLKPEEVPDRLIAGKVFVLASTSEGRPNVILEAMAARVPVVASDIPGTREMIGANERGLLFPAGDVEQCAACIGRLLSDKALAARLTANAGQWLIEQGLTWDNAALRYAALYERVHADIIEQRKQ